MAQQLRNLATALSSMALQAGDTVTRLQQLSDSAGLAIDVRRQLRAALTAVAAHVPQSTWSVVDVGVTVVRPITYGIIIVVISICMLPDAKRIGRFVARNLTTRSERDGEEYVRHIETAVMDGIKAQVLLSGIMDASVGLAMWLLGLVGAFPSGGRYALFFGV